MTANISSRKGAWLGSWNIQSDSAQFSMCGWPEFIEETRSWGGSDIADDYTYCCQARAKLMERLQVTADEAAKVRDWSTGQLSRFFRVLFRLSRTFRPCADTTTTCTMRKALAIARPRSVAAAQQRSAFLFQRALQAGIYPVQRYIFSLRFVALVGHGREQLLGRPVLRRAGQQGYVGCDDENVHCERAERAQSRQRPRFQLGVERELCGTAARRFSRSLGFRLADLYSTLGLAVTRGCRCLEFRCLINKASK